MSHQTRRTVLRRGGAGLAGVMATSAGCLSGLSPVGDDGPSYTDWLYAPHEFSSSDRYPIVMFEPAAIDEHRSQLSDSLRELLASAEETLSPVYFETVDSVLLMDRSYVIQGEYTRSDVVSTLTQIGYVEQDTYKEYAIYTHSWGSPVAVSDETLILAEESDSSAPYQEMIQSIIDAKQKDVERYTDQNAAFASLSKHLSGEIVWSGGSRRQPYSSVFSRCHRSTVRPLR